MIRAARLATLLACLSSQPALAHAVSLSEACPGDFRKEADGLCYLEIAYQHYDVGMQGLRKAFPVETDGLSPKLIDLGRLLFFDPILSGDQDLSCAHCHHPDFGLSDGRPRAMGAGGRGWGPARQGGAELRRASPSLWNVAFMESFFWDGRAASLEEQAEGPLFSAAEMGNTRERLEHSLNAVPAYRALFGQVFDLAGGASIRTQHVTRALATFERTLISVSSRYDLYAHGIYGALDAREIRGLNVFRSFVARCSECHTPPLFSNQQLAVIGVPDPEGLPPDPGAAEPTGIPGLDGAFKVPSLRNIARTGPYMHAGSFATLEDTVRFYNDGGGRAFPELNRGRMIHWHIVRPELAEAEVEALVAFLGAITDERNRPEIPPAVPSGLPVVARGAFEPRASEDE